MTVLGVGIETAVLPGYGACNYPSTVVHWSSVDPHHQCFELLYNGQPLTVDKGKKVSLPYPHQCNARVLFFKMGFWEGFNSRNPSKSGLLSKKSGVLFKKNPKNKTFHIHGFLFKSSVALKRIQYLSTKFLAGL